VRGAEGGLQDAYARLGMRVCRGEVQDSAGLMQDRDSCGGGDGVGRVKATARCLASSRERLGTRTAGACAKPVLALADMETSPEPPQVGMHCIASIRLLSVQQAVSIC